MKHIFRISYLGWCKPENYLLSPLVTTTHTALECNFSIFIILIILMWFLSHEIPGQHKRKETKGSGHLFCLYSVVFKASDFCNNCSLSSKYNYSLHNFSRSIIFCCSKHWQFSCQNHYSSNSGLFIFSPLFLWCRTEVFSLFTLTF